MDPDRIVYARCENGHGGLIGGNTIDGEVEFDDEGNLVKYELICLECGADAHPED